MQRTLLLGLGNILYGDEGVGVHLLHHLRRKYDFPEALNLMDGGALGWHLVDTLSRYPRVVIMDAVAAEVGTIYRFSYRDIPPGVKYGKLSSHEWELPDLLTLMDLHGDAPQATIVAIGVDPLETLTEQVQVGLTARVCTRVSALEAAVLAELESLGLRPLTVRPAMTFETDLAHMARIA